MKWNKATIKEEVVKYASISEWRKSSFSSYVIAARKGWLKECSANLKRIVGRWDENAVIKEAKKFSSKSEWAKKSSGSYDAAIDNGWIKKASSHMSRPKKVAKWDVKSITEDAIKYKSRSEWIKNGQGPYKAAQRLGILENIPLGKISGFSFMEKDLLNHIKSMYVDAISKRFKVLDKTIPFKWFEIDIYLNTMKKGIEFDGTYWHSEKALKKSRPHLSDEIIHDYHKIKDEYFKSIGIEILHITEAEWIADKTKAIEKCISFLESK